MLHSTYTRRKSVLIKRLALSILSLVMIISPAFAIMPELEGMTREAAAVQLASYYGLEDESRLYFDDTESIENISAVKKVVRAGLMDGIYNSFLPDDVISNDDIELIRSKTGDDDFIVIRGNREYSTGVIFSDVVFGGNVVFRSSRTTLDDVRILGNLYLDMDATISFRGTARVIEAKGRISGEIRTGSRIEYLYLWGNDTDIVIDGSIGTLVVYGSNVRVSGNGDIDTVRANGSGLSCSILPNHITVGDMVYRVDDLPLFSGIMYDPSTEGPADSPDRSKIVESGDRTPTFTELETGNTPYHSGPIDISHPFSSIYCSGGRIDGEAYGYIEREFIMSGDANVYNLYPNDVPYVVMENVPYATRVLMRYPDPGVKEPSGNIVVEILNASSGYDLEDFWRRAWDVIMENGDVYVAITAQSDAAEALKKFDSERYSEIDWNGEDGLVFDMLTQLGNVLRKNPSLILDERIPVESIILVGQSWSGDYINTYTSVFYDYYNAESTLFDGYLGIANPAETFIASGVAGPARSFRPMTEPYIVIMSQAEHYFGSYGNWYRDFEYIRIPDGDEDWQIRFYEVAGAGHSDPVSPVIPNDSELMLINGSGRGMKEYNGDERPSDLQLDMVIRASYENLLSWIRYAIPAPPADNHWITYRTVVDPFIGDMPECMTDKDGNAVGGIRMPQIEAPVACYKPFRNDTSKTDGSMIYFTKERLSELYPEGYYDYMRAFGEAASRILSEGFLTREDYAVLMRDGRNIGLFI